MVLRPPPPSLATRMSKEVSQEGWAQTCALMEVMLMVWSCVQALSRGILPDHHSCPPYGLSVLQVRERPERIGPGPAHSWAVCGRLLPWMSRLSLGFSVPVSLAVSQLSWEPSVPDGLQP